MMIRSASTPILGSLLASSACSSSRFSDSANHGHSNNHPLERTSSDNIHKLSFLHRGSAHHPHLNAASFHTSSRRFSPLPAGSQPDSHHGAAGGFRRVRSDGNLHGLAAAEAEYHDDVRRPSDLPPPIRSRRTPSVLESIPSFSFYNSREQDAVVEEEGEDDEEEEEVDNVKEGIERSVTIGENIEGEFFFSGEKRNGAMNAREETGTSPLFLARGLGLDAGDVGSDLIVGFGSGAGGDGGGYHILVDNGGDQSGLEAYYKKMVEEDPCNALFLRNYAQFLYQSKSYPKRAEEYYSRAILAESGDGEVLSQYAKLIWELHRDRVRASSYFEQAVQAAPQDSHVLAAYAGFLWETEDEQDGDDGEVGRSQDYPGAQVSYGALASANVR